MDASQRAHVAAEAADEAGGVDAALLGAYLSRLDAAAEHGQRLDDEDLADARAAGSRAADAGVPLHALVDLYLSATWRAWRELGAVRAAADLTSVHAVAEAVLRAADDAVAAAADGYQSARRWAIRREEAARREFVDDLLGGGDTASLLERGEHFGLDLAAPHLVVVAAGPTPFRDATPMQSRVEDALAPAAGASRSLVTSKDGQLVCILPSAPGDDTERMVRALTESVRRTEAGSEDVHGRVTGAVEPSWRAGVGRTFSGPAGIRRSYDEGREAITLAARLLLPEPVTNATDMLVYQVLLRDRTAIADLIETVLTPLQHARGGALPLLDTLTAYFASGLNSAATARTLRLSVRAVTYRLSRVRALTGYDPADPRQRYVLQTAVLGAQLLRDPLEAA